MIFFNLVIFHFQPPGHNLHDLLMPTFYTFRSSVSEMRSRGPHTLSDACFNLQPSRLPYTYSTVEDDRQILNGPEPTFDPVAYSSYAEDY